MSFTHLHLHTEYSLLDGAIRLRDLPARLKELGMTAAAMTDHGGMYGLVDFYEVMTEAGLHPVLGCEVYVAFGDRRGRDVQDRGQNHLILLAETDEGLRNLYKLVSLGHVEGYYYKPRIDKETLAKHSEGLIALSACLSGEVASAILKGELQKARESAIWHKEVFGADNYFLEIQANQQPEQLRVNQVLAQFSKELDIPLVATNDCHYLTKEDSRAQEILMCLQTGKRLSDTDRMRFSEDSFYLKSEDEMRQALGQYAEALENTNRIAARCQAAPEFDRLSLPHFDTPDSIPAMDYLRRLTKEGLEARLSKAEPADDPQVYEERLETELGVIEQMGFTDYFLIVWDFIRYAREKEIMVGPGRGSGAGSLVAWALQITNLDPIRYGLIFERFLNIDRISMPDFDIDFCYERRPEVIDYVTRKYGSHRTSQVITFGTLAAKAAVRDVARVLDLSYAEGDRLAKLIPNDLNMTLDRALEMNPELKELYDSDEQAHEVIDMAKRLEGMPRHASTHAAGVVIAGEEITHLAPLARNDDAIVVQYTKENIERVGLLKFDFLGLRTLTVMRDTRDLVEANTGTLLDYDKIPLDDRAVYEMISAGDTGAVFQLESGGMTSFMKELKPENFEDIIAGISLFRPGPMEQIPRYVRSRHDASQITYEHPLLEPILNVTYGCIVYQEQVMQIVRDVGGFTLGQADIVRRAMSKKKPELLASYRKLFVEGGTDEQGRPVDGAVKRGVPEEVAHQIFAEVEAFAGYAFNKAHAACYALLAYLTGWLKVYYPVEFMAAMLNSFLDNLGKASQYVDQCKGMGISILPPDVNRSSARFTTENGQIRFALAAIKHVGEDAVTALVNEREANGEFASFGEFLRRAQAQGANRKMIEALIQSSALDSFGFGRAPMVTAVEPYLNLVSQSRRQKMEGQLTMFDMGVEEEAPAEPVLQDVKDYSRLQKLEYEQDLLGMYVTGHPLDAYARQLKHADHMLSDVLNPPPTVSDEEEDVQSFDAHAAFNGQRDKGPVSMAGMVVVRRNQTTRKGELMSFLTMEDLSGRFEVIVFPRVLREAGDLIREGRVLIVRGRVSARDNEDNQLIADSFVLLEEDQDNMQAMKPEPQVQEADPPYLPPDSPSYPDPSGAYGDPREDTVSYQESEEEEAELPPKGKCQTAFIRIKPEHLDCAAERLEASRSIYPGPHNLMLIAFTEEQPEIRKLEGFYLHRSFMLYLVQQFGLDSIWVVDDVRAEVPRIDYNEGQLA